MKFKTVAIIGAGTMGSGIATNIAQHGIDVRIIDVSDQAVDRSIEMVGKFYEKNAEKGRMSIEDATAAKARLSGGTDIELAGSADLVIEAVFERYDIKEELFGRLNSVLSDHTVVATNTSCLTVSGLAEAVKYPTRFLGLHYFNPAAINPIIEVVRGDKTTQDIIDRSVEFCRTTSKRPILCKDSYGFALNRFFCPYSNEAVRLLEENVGTPAQIDQVAQRTLGIAAGPFLVMNLVGMQTMAHAAENLEPHGPFYAPSSKVKEMGKSNGKWDIGEAPAHDANAEANIADRLWGATFLPILQELDEKVATPADIDMGAALALRFGKAPCATMDAMGRDEVARIISYYCETYAIKEPSSLSKVGTLIG